MFAILPQSAYSVKIGHGVSKARYSLGSVREFRRLLEQLTKKMRCLNEAILE
jgi:hypothetical protein